MKQPSLLAVALMLSAFGVGAWSEDGAWAQVGPCAGDCDHDGRVTVDELVTGVNMALGRLPVDRCPDLSGGDDDVTVNELIAAVNSALAGCGSQANRAPRASDVSFSAEAATAYAQKQLIGSDADNDTIAYELIADESGTGYGFAYVNPESGMLYVTVAADFRGTIVLPYRVTDGKQFSNTANATLEVHAVIPSRSSGLRDVSPKEYATFPRGFYHGAVLGAPGSNPTLPSSVDLSDDFPVPGNQGHQNSCVAWSLGYAIKTYQERVELGWSLEPAEHRFSPAYLYNLLNGGLDDGVVYNKGLDFLVNEGVATLARMPYDETDFLTQPSAAARAEASQFKAKSWKAVNGVLEAKDALANRLPVFMVIQLLDDIYGLRGPDSVYNTFGGAWHTGHGVAAVGYDDNRYGGAFKIMNSWGQGWGEGGYFWMPYTATNVIVDTPNGPTRVLTGSVVIEDLPDPYIPDPDPVDPTPAAQSPDLQVTDWTAYYDETPGGSGSLQYTVTNTGIATAAAGAHVALILSRDPTFTSSNILVVYEPIPFELTPGSTAYRDENNTIAFTFPSDLEPGQYYMAVWVDIWDNVAEWNENDNISPSTSMVDIVNTLPDMEVTTWYSEWDELGLGSLTYEVVNNGASVALAGWQISLALSPNDVFGDGDETVLFRSPPASICTQAKPCTGTIRRLRAFRCTSIRSEIRCRTESTI
jgi:C1A family cysteine protease